MKYKAKVNTFFSGKYIPAGTQIEGDFRQIDPKGEIYELISKDPTPDSANAKTPTGERIDKLRAIAKSLNIKGWQLLKTEKSLEKAINKIKDDEPDDLSDVSDNAPKPSNEDAPVLEMNLGTIPPEGVQE